MKIHLGLICASVLLFIETPAADSAMEGTWRWNFTMPDGTISTPTLRLILEDGQLTGTSSFRAGTEVPITHVLLSGNQLRFDVVRSRDGQTVTTTYTGNLSGKSLIGTIQSNWAGAPQTYEWHAEKLQGPNGTWKWIVLSGERKVETQVSLRQKGSRLEGAVASRGRGRPAKIEKGTIDDDGQLSFEVEMGPPESRRFLRYSGKLSNDTITGTAQSTFAGVTHESEWVARRSSQ